MTQGKARKRILWSGMKHRILQSAFGFLLVLLISGAGFAQVTPQELIERGKRELAAKNYLAAKASFEEAARLGPTLPEAYLYRGKVQWDDALALADFDKAIELKPNYAEAFFERGLQRDLNNDRTGALSDYNRAIELNPRYVEAYMTRAVLYLLDGKGMLAIADYTRVIALKPDGTSYYVRGNSYLEIGQYANAVKDLTTSIRLDPTYYWSYMQRAKAYRNLGKFRLAFADEQKAATIGPPKID